MLKSLQNSTNINHDEARQIKTVCAGKKLQQKKLSRQLRLVT